MGDIYERSTREVVDTEGCSKCGSIAGQPCVNKKGEPMGTYAHSARFKAAQVTELNSQPATELLVTEHTKSATSLDAMAERNEKERARRIEMMRGGLQLVVGLEGYARMLDHVARLLVDYDVDDVILTYNPPN